MVIEMKKMLFPLLFCFLYVGSQVSCTQAAKLPVPHPFLCMYGHGSAPHLADQTGLAAQPEDPDLNSQFRKIIPPFNVIEGISTDAAFIQELRAGGRIYACHVINGENATQEQLLAEWRAPFDNELGGLLPGGYDAIAIDELRGDENGSVQSDRVCAALRQLRSLYPDKLIFVAANWPLAHYIDKHTDQLNAVNQYADILMLEHYAYESNPQYDLFSFYAANIQAKIPGLLEKTVYGLYIAQDGLVKGRGFVADTSTDKGFWGFLDEQLHLIRNDPHAAVMSGVMFWVYYRSEVDLTPDYVARLADHYYVQKKTSYFGDGSDGQMITNPQFETGTEGWTLTPGSGGTVARFHYAAEGVAPTWNRTSEYCKHGSYGLKTVRGSTCNQAAWSAAVDKNMIYTFSAFVMAASGTNHRARVTIADSDGIDITARQIAHVDAGAWSRILFNFQPTTDTVQIILNDQPVAAGTILYWDFVELEAAYSASVPPPPAKNYLDEK